MKHTSFTFDDVRFVPKSARKLKSEYCIFVQKSVTLHANGIIHLIFH